MYGISQFREQRSDWKPCVTRNEDEDHYLAPPNYRIIYVARGYAHVAQVYKKYIMVANDEEGDGQLNLNW